MDVSKAAGKSGGEGTSKKKKSKKKSGGKGGSVGKGKAKNQWTTTPEDDNYNVDDGMKKLEKMDVSEAPGKSCGEGSSKKKKPKKKSGGSVGKGISDLEMLYGEDKKSEKEPAETAEKTEAAGEKETDDLSDILLRGLKEVRITVCMKKLEKKDVSEAAGKSGGECSSKKKKPKKKSGGKGGSVGKGISDLEKAKNQWTTTPEVGVVVH
ncbi:hypothetical protein Tco_1205003 [Tanacetum coccineum]